MRICRIYFFIVLFLYEWKGPYTVFAPSDAAFAKLPPGTVDALLKDIPKLKKILEFHVHSGKMSPTRNGRTLDTILIGEDDFPKQLTVKVTNWTCQSFLFGGQEKPGNVSLTTHYYLRNI